MSTGHKLALPFSGSLKKCPPDINSLFRFQAREKNVPRTFFLIKSILNSDLF